MCRLGAPFFAAHRCTAGMLNEYDFLCPLRALQGAYITARTVVTHDGLRGLYKGFGTVVLGMFPARMVS
jgi:hypothetical protein